MTEIISYFTVILTEKTSYFAIKLTEKTSYYTLNIMYMHLHPLFIDHATLILTPLLEQ
jgi:hypothetical protein